MVNYRYILIFLFLLAALPGFCGEKEKFLEYYYTAKNIVSELNAVSADIEKAKPHKGVSDTTAESLKNKLIQVRQGFDNIMVYSEKAEGINEGYIRYIDKELIALSIAQDYYDSKDKATRNKLSDALENADREKEKADNLWYNEISKYGLGG